MSEQNKACPYCGTDAEVRSLGHITCGNKICINHQLGDDYPMWAARDWNTRPIEDRMGGELAAANGLLDEVEAEIRDTFGHLEWPKLFELFAKRREVE